MVNQIEIVDGEVYFPPGITVDDFEKFMKAHDGRTTARGTFGGDTAQPEKTEDNTLWQKAVEVRDAIGRMMTSTKEWITTRVDQLQSTSLKSPEELYITVVNDYLIDTIQKDGRVGGDSVTELTPASTAMVASPTFLKTVESIIASIAKKILGALVTIMHALIPLLIKFIDLMKSMVRKSIQNLDRLAAIFVDMLSKLFSDAKGGERKDKEQVSSKELTKLNESIQKATDNLEYITETELDMDWAEEFDSGMPIPSFARKNLAQHYWAHNAFSFAKYVKGLSATIAIILAGSFIAGPVAGFVVLFLVTAFVGAFATCHLIAGLSIFDYDPIAIELGYECRKRSTITGAQFFKTQSRIGSRLVDMLAHNYLKSWRKNELGYKSFYVKLADSKMNSLPSPLPSFKPEKGTNITEDCQWCMVAYDRVTGIMDTIAQIETFSDDRGALTYYYKKLVDYIELCKKADNGPGYTHASRSKYINKLDEIKWYIQLQIYYLQYIEGLNVEHYMDTNTYITAMLRDESITGHVHVVNDERPITISNEAGRAVSILTRLFGKVGGLTSLVSWGNKVELLLGSYSEQLDNRSDFEMYQDRLFPNFKKWMDKKDPLFLTRIPKTNTQNKGLKSMIADADVDADQLVPSKNHSVISKLSNVKPSTVFTVKQTGVEHLSRDTASKVEKHARHESIDNTDTSEPVLQESTPFSQKFQRPVTRFDSRPVTRFDSRPVTRFNSGGGVSDESLDQNSTDSSLVFHASVAIVALAGVVAGALKF